MPTPQEMYHLTNTYANGNQDKMRDVIHHAVYSEKFNQRCKDWMTTDADRKIWDEIIGSLRGILTKWNDRVDKKGIRSD